ncbi:MAG: hypothetical protein ACP5NU_03715 [Methanomicrobiales archaeon]|jgi:hypothetical protein|nr:MAG: hypothetical protein BWY45_03109 [Euryarchaeota archaeon ADurb.Bin294]
MLALIARRGSVSPPHFVHGFLGLILILVAHFEHLMRTGLLDVSMSASFVPIYVRSQPHRGQVTRMLVNISTHLSFSSSAGC